MWGLKWAESEATKAPSFVSVAADGRIALWALSKDQLAVQDVLSLTVPGSQAEGDKHGMLASGLCFDFHKVPAHSAAMAALRGLSGRGHALLGVAQGAPLPAGHAGRSRLVGSSAQLALLAVHEQQQQRQRDHTGAEVVPSQPLSHGPAVHPHWLQAQDHMFVVGTDSGALHKCSTAYASDYLASYAGHDTAVYAVRWNLCHPRSFLSSSADWSVKLWDSNLDEVHLHSGLALPGLSATGTPRLQMLQGFPFIRDSLSAAR